ncbi:MAG: hypothetical protein K0Q51_1057 [Rickettsiaceae bacterium]|jgi:hypothetical protein|nr:hypothetical protein [Rickettsiaceae bacterium]
MSLVGNSIKDEGINALGLALKHNFTILQLNGINNEEIEKYTTRNNKLLEEAFEHAFEYIYKGNNVNIVDGHISLNPISAKDLFMLIHHKEEVKDKLDGKEQGFSFGEFMNELQIYEKINFFKLLGICRDHGSSGKFTALPLDMIPEISKFYSYKPTIAGDIKAETHAD